MNKEEMKVDARCICVCAKLIKNYKHYIILIYTLFLHYGHYVILLYTLIMAKPLNINNV